MTIKEKEFISFQATLTTLTTANTRAEDLLRLKYLKGADSTLISADHGTSMPYEEKNIPGISELVKQEKVASGSCDGNTSYLDGRDR